MTSSGPTVDQVDARAYVIPTDRPEGDGTLAWDSTGMVVVTVRSATTSGVGWTYAPVAACHLVRDVLAGIVTGGDAMAVPRHNEQMARAVRNAGRPGIAACAISAVDIALWDLKARLLGLPLVDLFGRMDDVVAVYGSGGFTTYDDDTTVAQLRHWVEELGLPRVKIKIGESWGTAPQRDLHRAELARSVVGPDVELYVDANGAYQAKQAVRLGRTMRSDAGITWFEEPVSSDDLAGLAEVRGLLDVDVAAGEYGYSPHYFTRMIAANALDCIQIDVTRCGGYTAWMAIAHSAAAACLSVSGHCAPHLHAVAAASVGNVRHVEYFHDHVRIEQRLFTGLPVLHDGGLLVGTSPGHGMELRQQAAERFRVA